MMHGQKNISLHLLLRRNPKTWIKYSVFSGKNSQS